MKRIFNAKHLLAAAIGIGALAVASAAQARSDVFFSIGFNAPYGYVQPAPAYVPPPSVYYQPAPVYYQPAPVYYEPAPVYYQPQTIYYAPRPAHYGHRHRAHDRRGGWGDADRDGVPNRYDRAPNNPYRR